MLKAGIITLTLKLKEFSGNLPHHIHRVPGHGKLIPPAKRFGRAVLPAAKKRPRGFMRIAQIGVGWWTVTVAFIGAVLPLGYASLRPPTDWAWSLHVSLVYPP